MTDYRRAFKIACELLNGDVLYGIDADTIFKIMMNKDGMTSSSSYEEYILNHLQDLDHGQYAIEALEQEPTTKNDLGVDCISKQAVLNKILKFSVTDGRSVSVTGLWTEVNELPSVTIRPKGHWKLVQRGKLIDVCCSNCGAVRIKEYAYNYTIDELDKEDINECFESAEMRHCPNCGAKMEGEA